MGNRDRSRDRAKRRAKREQKEYEKKKREERIMDKNKEEKAESKESKDELRKQGKDKLEKIEKKQEKSAARLKSSISVIGNGMKAISGIQDIAAGMKDFASSAIDAESINNKLRNSMLGVSGTTDTHVDSIKDRADELEKQTYVESKAQLAGAAQLASYKLQSDTIQSLMPAMAYLSVGMNGVNVSQEQMAATASMIGDAFNGQLDGLEAVGISLDEHQLKMMKTGTEIEKADILSNALTQTYKTLSDKMKETGAGTMQQLENNFGNLKETVGATLLPVLKEFSTWFQDNMPQIEQIVTSVVQVGIGAFNVFMTALDWIVNNLDVVKIAVIALAAIWIIHTIGVGILTAAYALQALGLGVATTAQWGLNAAMIASPIGPVVAGLGIVIAVIAAVIGIIVALVKHWDKLSAAFKKVKEFFTGWNKTDGESKEASIETENKVTTTFDTKGKPEGLSAISGIKASSQNTIGISAFTPSTTDTKSLLKGYSGYDTSVESKGNLGQLKTSSYGQSVYQGQEKSSKNNIVININGTNKSTEQIVNEMVPKLRLALVNM